MNFANFQVDFRSTWKIQKRLCIVKHTNPCGVASADDLQKAYDKAFSTDPTSAFGGVIALNKTATEDVIKKMIDNKTAIYNLKHDQRSLNKIGSGSKLTKVNLDILPEYISSNKEKFDEWLED